MTGARLLRSWSESSSVVFPCLAAITAVVILVSEDVRGWLALTVLVGLVPWALIAGGVPVSPVVFAPAVMVPTAIGSFNGIQGVVFFGLIATVWLGTTGSGRALAGAVTVASLALSAVAAVVGDHGLDKGALYFPVGALLTFLCGELFRRERSLVTDLQAARDELSERAAEHERTRIAREIHDVVGHSLTVVQLYVAGARRQLALDPALADATLLKAEEIGRESLDHLRQVVGLLRDEDGHSAGTAAPMPRASDVATLVSSARDAGLDVALEVNGELETVEPTVGLAAYRVVQESIANARHHAPGAPVEVSMAVRCGHLDVTVHNRAVEVAIDPDDDQRHGTGLVGMRERAAACHGDLWAGPTDDGWEVRCRLPLAKARS